MILPGTARELDLILARTQHDARLPSVVAGLVRDGEMVWTGSRGRCVRLGEDACAGAQTQYKIGSITKTMTAALVLLACERGELSLDARLGEVLADPPFATATVRQLLSHSAGLSAEPAGTWWERSEGGDFVALQQAHAGAQPVLVPGAELHYSNLGYGLLGAVIEQVTGHSWFEALCAEVLEPLGMERTTYAAQDDAAQGFSVDALSDELFVEPLPDTGAMAPAGQLWSTVDDLATWATALIDSDRSVLSATSLRAMRTPTAGSADDRSGTTWGLGLSVWAGGGRMVIGHGGSMPGFVSGLCVDVDARVGAVLLSNGAYGLGDATRRLLDRAVALEPTLPSEWAPTATSDVPEPVRDVLGVWHWGNAPSRLRWRGGRLHLEPIGPGRAMTFAPGDEPDTYVGTSGYLKGETLRAVRRGEGEVGHLEAATFIYTRTPYDPDAPIPGG